MSDEVNVMNLSQIARGRRTSTRWFQAGQLRTIITTPGVDYNEELVSLVGVEYDQAKAAWESFLEEVGCTVESNDELNFDTGKITRKPKE